MATTTNLTFTLLDLNDTAGYNSINTVITSIDNKLRYRMPPTGAVMLWDTAATGTYGIIPTGWESLGASVSGLPTLTGSYVYIRKNTTL